MNLKTKLQINPCDWELWEQSHERSAMCANLLVSARTNAPGAWFKFFSLPRGVRPQVAARRPAPPSASKSQMLFRVK